MRKYGDLIEQENLYVTHAVLFSHSVTSFYRKSQKHFSQQRKG